MAEHWTVAPGVEGSSPFVHPKKEGFRVKGRGSREEAEMLRGLLWISMTIRNRARTGYTPYTLFSCAHSSAG